MSYLSIQEQLEKARLAHVRAVIEDVKHRVSLSRRLQTDASGDLIYDLFSQLYDREAEMFKNFGIEDGHKLLIETFPQCDGPSAEDRDGGSK